MIKNFICIAIVSSAILASPQYSSTSVVTVVGAVIKSKDTVEVVDKYKREDCPVCEGKGWYMSGDGIKKIECQYCEP